MSGAPSPLVSVVRCIIVAALLALGACSDNDHTPIVADTTVDNTDKAMFLTAPGSSGDRSASDYRLGRTMAYASSFTVNRI